MRSKDVGPDQNLDAISKPDELDGGKGDLQLGSPPQKNHNYSFNMGAGSNKDCVKGTHENLARSGHRLKLSTMKGNFFSGDVEDLISISQDMDDDWDEDALIAEWTKVENKTKGKNKNNTREGEKILPKNNKKGPKPKGEAVRMFLDYVENKKF